MIPSFQPSQFREILAIGSHPDDIEIGCGGTLLTLLQNAAPETRITWAVFSGNSNRTREAQQSAAAYLENVDSRVLCFDFPDSYFPSQWEAIKSEFHRLASECDPDLIFTHRLSDRHQDHRVLAELTWNAFRQHLILEYEIPKYEGDLRENNFFCPLDSATVDLKVDWLDKFFPSQAKRPWFSPDLFRAQLRLRGIECPGSSGDASIEFAEGFYCRKFRLF